MSAFDIGARALALRAIAESAQTFATVSQAALPTSINALMTSGYSTHGLGAGLYVSDALATAALAAAHPLAVFAAEGGRYFRLAGDAEGFITPEQLGCGTYAAGTNQQPIIQAAIAYCKAAGLKGVKFPQERYELWCPQRTGNFDDNANHTGNFIVIDGFGCSLIGTHPNRTTLHCKGPTGGNLQTDYQVWTSSTYGGQVIWRGNGIKLTGTAAVYGARPAESTLSHAYLKDLILYSDAVGVRNPAWPSYPRTRDATGVRENCWDITNKGYYSQNNVHVGNLYAENFDVIGFLGEAFYTSGWRTSNIVLRNCTVKHTNGQALNPNGNNVLDVDGFYAENCGMAVEGWHGTALSRVVNAHFKDCSGTNGGLGGAGEDATGLRADGSAPTAYLEMTLENCATFYVGSYTQGRITAIDTNVTLSPANATQVIRGVDVDIMTVVHKKSVSLPISFGGATGGSQQVSNNVVRLRVMRTPNAIANNFYVANLMAQSNSIGPNNYVYARGEGIGQIGYVSSVTDNYVALIDEGIVPLTANMGQSFDPTTTASPDMGMGVVMGSGFSGGNGVFTVNLPALTMYQHNAQLVVRNRGSAAQFIEVADAGVKKALLGANDVVRVRANKITSKWEVVQVPPPRSATASIAITSTALSAESGPYTIALTGCRPWHKAEVIPPSLMTGFGVTAVRAETDQVKFWVRNYDGANPATLAALTYTARCWVAPN